MHQLCAGNKKQAVQSFVPGCKGLLHACQRHAPAEELVLPDVPSIMGLCQLPSPKLVHPLHSVQSQMLILVRHEHKAGGRLLSHTPKQAVIVQGH